MFMAIILTLFQKRLKVYFQNAAIDVKKNVTNIFKETVKKVE